MIHVVCCALFLLRLAGLSAAAEEVNFQAHRGGLKEVPENTLAAYRYAWNLGAIPEVDICSSSDGVIICLHDNTLKRTTNASSKADVPVAQLTYDEIRQWDAGAWFDPKYAGEKIPCLEEVLRELAARKDARIYLDLKNVDLKQLAALVDKFDVTSRVIFCHNKTESCTAMKAAVPGLRTMLWIGGEPEEIREAFLKVAEGDFAGLDQVQLHLKAEPKDSGGVRYLLDEEFLRRALEMTAARKVDLEVLPFAFDCDSIASLLRTGIRWFATDEPKRFKSCVEGYFDGRQ